MEPSELRHAMERLQQRRAELYDQCIKTEYRKVLKRLPDDLTVLDILKWLHGEGPQLFNGEPYPFPPRLLSTELYEAALELFGEIQ